MKNFKNIFTIALFVLGFANVVQAQSNNSSQQVSVNVAEIDVISISGNVAFTFSQATAGKSLDSVTGSASWSVSTNGRNRKITAELDSDLPKGLDLKVGMEAPNGAHSTGMKELSAKPKHLIQNLTSVSQSGMAINYEVTAKVDVASSSYARTILFTITKN